MPRIALYTLTWSQDHACYELYMQGRLEHCFTSKDTDRWLAWLDTASSFAFRGSAGRLNLYKEARRDAGHYWYAYSTADNRTHKRYLGQQSRVTFARLEEVARTLSHMVSSPTPEQNAPSQEVVSDLPLGQDAPSEPSLLFTRLVPPLLPSELVRREHLLARLDAAQTHRLTLLAASAGWGKTVLLAMWAARSRFPVAWLSLDALDNDPSRFWSSVLLALRQRGAFTPLVGEQALEMLRSSQLFCLNTILTTFLNDLSGQSTPVYFVLDDYHVIENQAIHDSLLFLLEHLPAHFHLLLASRADPPLGLARLRTRGALLEFRDVDLRFQEAEAAQFLNRTMALALDPPEIVLLAQRTEGWVAGLHLAALALPRYQDRAAFVRGFAGSHRYLLDYVQEDVLAHIAQPLQDFLLHCAILSRMSAPLCQVVTGQADLQMSQRMLELLEQSNLFIVPLDEERRWYRLHDLFREALLARLRTLQPEIVPVLHRRAASFYTQQREWSEAITHYLLAQDCFSALDLMEQATEQFWLRGETATLFHWIMDLPAEVIRVRAHFVLKVAWYLLSTFSHTTKAQLIPARAQVERLLVCVEEALLWRERERQQDQEGVFHSQLSLLRQRIYLLRAMSELNNLEAHNDWKQYALLARQVLQIQQDDEIIWRMIPLGVAFMYRYTILHEGAFLVPELLEAKQQANQSGERFVMIKVRQWLAQAFLQAGELRLAYQENQEALALLELIKGHAILAGYFAHCQAYIFFEWNQLDEARAILRKMIPDAAAWQQIDLLAWGYRLLAEVEVAAGNLLAAAQVLQEAQLRLPEAKGLYQFWRTGIQVRLWLAQGNMVEANAWAARMVYRCDDWNPQQTREFLTLILVYFAQKQYSYALSLLEEFREHLDRPGNLDDTIYFLSYYATALDQTGRCAQAREVALRLLRLTESAGYRRIYLDIGEPMKRLLQSLLDAYQEPSAEPTPGPGSALATLLDAFEQEEAMHATRRAKSRSDSSQTSYASVSLSLDLSAVLDESALVGALTSQELRVLSLLATGLSNQAIAQELVVSRNTVKTHLKNLYGKLQVNNRIQASALARDLQLL